ncbi:uncharacterized protein TNCV_2176981 [Trichonephila clavipes]|uniref:Uncharacterized protein n=1 Tax=Trichonephila clavipes TaxID=2585209 RepID=A0A8X6VU23_TRICX|nr:uncharacterized protein TNCV_2176981 [Trichonephila clavipes]
MEEYLQKKIYVYRKSYHHYQKINITKTVSKFVLSSLGLSAFVMVPLAALSLSVGIVEVIDKALNIVERKEEDKQSYKFYKQLLNLYKTREISEEEVYKREEDFVNNLVRLPREKYMKQTLLNGYAYVSK